MKKIVCHDVGLGIPLAALCGIGMGVMFSTSAQAQAPQQQPSPEIQALNAQLGQVMQANHQCLTQAFTMSEQLKQLQAVTAERDALKAKYEPKPAAPAK